MINGELLNLQTHRKVAKIGMSTTLASVCLTSFFMRNRTARNLHIASGWAFVAFSLYHAGLYDNGIFRNMIVKKQKELAEKKRVKKSEISAFAWVNDGQKMEQIPTKKRQIHKPKTAI